MKEYLINIWSKGSFENLSDEEMGNFFSDFGNWVKNLEDNNQMVTRHRIVGDFNHATQSEGQTKIVKSPYHAGKNGLAGVFIVRAKDDAEAFELARNCPPVKHLNDTVEIVELAQ